MYFQKIRHPSNFKFAHAFADHTLHIGTKPVQALVRDFGEDVFHVELRDLTRWPIDARVLPMLDDAFDRGTSSSALHLTASGNLQLTNSQGETVLSGLEGASIGVCGSAFGDAGQGAHGGHERCNLVGY